MGRSGGRSSGGRSGGSRVGGGSSGGSSTRTSGKAGGARSSIYLIPGNGVGWYKGQRYSNDTIKPEEDDDEYQGYVNKADASLTTTIGLFVIGGIFGIVTIVLSLFNMWEYYKKREWSTAILIGAIICLVCALSLLLPAGLIVLPEIDEYNDLAEQRLEEIYSQISLTDPNASTTQPVPTPPVTMPPVTEPSTETNTVPPVTAGMGNFSYNLYGL